MSWNEQIALLPRFFRYTDRCCLMTTRNDSLCWHFLNCVIVYDIVIYFPIFIYVRKFKVISIG